MSTDNKVTIYHNPRCSKSRQTLQLVRDAGIEPEVIEYLKTPPTAEEMDAILTKLKMEPSELMRTKEAAFTELNLKGRHLTREQRGPDRVIVGRVGIAPGGIGQERGIGRVLWHGGLSCFEKTASGQARNDFILGVNSAKLR